MFCVARRTVTLEYCDWARLSAPRTYKKTRAVPMMATNTASMSSSLRRSMAGIPFARTICRPGGGWQYVSARIRVRMGWETRATLKRSESDARCAPGSPVAKWQRILRARGSRVMSRYGPRRRRLLGAAEEPGSAVESGDLVLVPADDDVALELQ